MCLFSDAGMDYVPPEGIFRFSAGEKEDCFDIEILDDEFLEPLETFTVRLMPSESLGNDIVFSRDTIDVRIVDRDGNVLVYSLNECTHYRSMFIFPEARLGFIDSSYEADEREGSVPVCIEVKASECIVNFAFNISFMTVDGSAGECNSLRHLPAVSNTHFFIPESTEDYLAQWRTLTFAPCELIQCLSVELVDDCVLEDAEVFNITLATISGQERRIIIDSDTGAEEITIVDDDGMFSFTQYCECVT